ncbi:hypothetical protein GCM10027051_16590 [Niabella terrae]
MKKIINITLAGRSISIEDNAYEKVQSYLESLRQYFNAEEGRDEIVADIEARLADLMHEKTRKNAGHVTEADVEEIIATLGRPEQFESEGSQQEQQTGSAPFTIPHKRRLYRDESNKILGGVCSGLANWLNMDPTVVRVLFAIVSFGGFGSGIFIYIGLWIFLPARNMEVYQGRKMYRDPDNKWFGGVAGGMGAYFNMNPNIIRWILAIPLLLNILKGVNLFGWNNDFTIFPNLLFNGLTGTFIFIYIVLWVLLPEAITPYQKMEMRGQPVDINTIKENVQSSMGDLGSRLQSWSQEVRESATNIGRKSAEFHAARHQEFSRQFGAAASRGGRGLGYVIAMIFKIFFIIVGGIIAISLLAVFLTILFSGFAWAPVNNFLWTSETQQMLGWGTLILFFGAPIVGLVVWLARKILNVSTPGNYLNWTFGGLWAIGWICLMFFLASITADFKRYEFSETPVMVQQPSGDRMIFRVSEPGLRYQGNFGWINNDRDRYFTGFYLAEDSLKLATIKLGFQKSEDSLYHISIIKQSMGKSVADALARNEKIHYRPISTDSIVDLPNGFVLDRNSKYRFQNLLVLVKVPVGKKINVDATVYDRLVDANFNFDHLRGSAISDKYDFIKLSRYRANTDYTMQPDGDLKSDREEEIRGGKAGVTDNNYRWQGDSAGRKAGRADSLFRDSSAAANIGSSANLDSTYRYDQSQPAAPDPQKEKLMEELRKKQQEIEALQQKLQNQ